MKGRQKWLVILIYRILMGISYEDKRRLQNNIKMDVLATRCEVGTTGSELCPAVVWSPLLWLML